MLHLMNWLESKFGLRLRYGDVPDFRSGFKVNGTEFSAGEVTVLDSVTAGKVTASKALVVDATKDLDDATDCLRNLKLSGTLTLGSTEVAETDIAKIDGITNGTVASGKAVVPTTGGVVDLLDITQPRTNGYNDRKVFTRAITGTLNPNRLAYYDVVNSQYKEAPGNASSVVGALLEAGAVTDANAALKVAGEASLVAAAPVYPGPIKSAYGGRVVNWFAGWLVSLTKYDQTGSEFTNQPATDGVTIVSDAAGDVSIGVRIHGHTGGTYAYEDMTTDAADGTTPVNSVKVDWDDIIAVEITSGTLAGTLTVKETSGGLSITTIAAAGTQSGVDAAADEGESNLFGSLPQVVAGGASTAYVGVEGKLATTGAVTREVVQLNGTTNVALANRYATVDKLFLGDVAAATTVSLLTGASADDAALIAGKAVAVATGLGQSVTAILN